MDVAEITRILKSGFGAGTRVRTRRPNALCQLHVPAYLADGDAAAIYVRPLEDGRLLMTDLGHTLMRLSYTRRVNAEVRATLAHLSKRHGFDLDEDRLVSTMRPEELLAGALGLIQIESEAEATIASTIVRGERSENFRAKVRDVLREGFKDDVQFDYHDPDDKDGLYKIDAFISGTAAPHPLGVAIAPTNLEAERAVSSKLKLAKTLPGGSRWIAIPRDQNAFDGKTRQRLMVEFLIPLPKFEDQPERLIPELRALAA
jgi:Domain of unknown function DUF1828